jgi:hypothetical protein
MAIHGPDLSGVKEMARLCVIAHFVAVAEADGRPATLRAMDAVKKSEAVTVKAGGSSAMLTEEAAMRGVTVEQLADAVLAEAAKAAALELARVRLSLAVDAARSEAEIQTLLSDAGIRLRENALTSR